MISFVPFPALPRPCPALFAVAADDRRGFDEKDFEKVAEFFDRAVSIALDIKTKTGPKLKDFKGALDTPQAVNAFPELAKLSAEVKEFARSFPTIGY